jgi:transposase IS116/IS110/IS902 family protein
MRGLLSACDSSEQSRIQRRSVRGAVYYRRRVRSARRQHGGGRPFVRAVHAGAAFTDVRQCKILRFVQRLRVERVACCYEAGPCGFELQRALTSHGVACAVIAPALIPRRPGDRIKTDRRNARHLAILDRAGALTAIHIPTEQEEAARDLFTIEPLRARAIRVRCFRGIDDPMALTIAVELGDARRFPSASRAMGFTGLVPSERSSGLKTARGITKRGRPIYDASWSKPPGATAIICLWAGVFNCANEAPRRPSLTTPGTRSACIAAIGNSPRAATPSNTSSPRSRANSPASSGPRWPCELTGRRRKENPREFDAIETSRLEFATLDRGSSRRIIVMRF